MAQQASISHFATQSRTVLSGSEKHPVSEPGVQKPATAFVKHMLVQPTTVFLSPAFCVE